MTLNTTPFSQRIMKSLCEKGQFPMLSPSLPACRREHRLQLLEGATYTGTQSSSCRGRLSSKSWTLLPAHHSLCHRAEHTAGMLPEHSKVSLCNTRRQAPSEHRTHFTYWGSVILFVCFPLGSSHHAVLVADIPMTAVQFTPSSHTFNSSFPTSFVGLIPSSSPRHSN